MCVRVCHDTHPYTASAYIRLLIVSWHLCVFGCVMTRWPVRMTCLMTPWCVRNGVSWHLCVSRNGINFHQSSKFTFLGVMGVQLNTSAPFHLRICRPSPLRSGHLDIKDAQCDATKVARKISYYIISRLGAVGSKRSVLGIKKFNFLQNWPNLQSRLELIWRSFFA